MDIQSFIFVDPTFQGLGDNENTKGGGGGGKYTSPSSEIVIFTALMYFH